MSVESAVGRPRNPDLDDAIHRAALILVARNGYGTVTLESIAREAQTSKTAIYRRWSGKAALVMDAFLAAAEPQIRLPDTLSLRNAIVGQMTALAAFFQTTSSGRTITGLIAESQTDPELADALQHRWLAPRRAAAIAQFATARRHGQLREDADDEILIDALYGPFYFRLMLGHAPIDQTFIEGIVDAVLDGVAPVEGSGPETDET